MRILTLCTLSLAAIGLAHAAAPVLMIDATPIDPRVLEIIGKYVTDSDFVRWRDIGADSSLAAKVKPSQRWDYARSLDELRFQVGRGCADRTMWYFSPASGRELQDVLGSVASAVKLIHGSGCPQAGIAPGAEFWGYQGHCKFDLDASAYQKVDWTQVDRVMVQGGAWLREGCANGAENYRKFMTTLIAYLRQRNPRIQVYAHLSLRLTPPAMLVDAMRALAADVDVVSLGYPLYGEHVYCTPENLEAVLSARLQPRR